MKKILTRWHKATERDEQLAPPMVDSKHLISTTDSLRAAAQDGQVSPLLLSLGRAVETGCLELTRPSVPTVLSTETVQAFVEAFVDALNALPKDPSDTITARRQQALIADIGERAGRSALLLSGGGALGNYHIGVVRALMAEGLLPNVITGSSAGALMAAIVGSRPDNELEILFADGAKKLAAGPTSQRLDDTRLRHAVVTMIGDITFAEAAERSGRAVNIVVAAQDAKRGGLVLNAHTTPDVLLSDAVHASCAIPFIFKPVELRQRGADGRIEPFMPGTRWIDGSIYADLPCEAVRKIYGVDRCIASMVNPIVLPFITHPDRDGVAVHWAAAVGVNWMKMFVGYGTTLVLPFTKVLPAATLALEMWQRVAQQSYRTDITILPGRRFHDPSSIVCHAGEGEVRAFIQEGESATRGKMGLLRIALSIERAVARFTRSENQCIDSFDKKLEKIE